MVRSSIVDTYQPLLDSHRYRQVEALLILHARQKPMTRNELQDCYTHRIDKAIFYALRDHGLVEALSREDGVRAKKYAITEAGIIEARYWIAFRTVGT